MVTDPQTHKQVHINKQTNSQTRPITIHYAAASAQCSCIHFVVVYHCNIHYKDVVKHSINVEYKFIHVFVALSPCVLIQKYLHVACLVSASASTFWPRITACDLWRVAVAVCQKIRPNTKSLGFCFWTLLQATVLYGLRCRTASSVAAAVRCC